MCQELKLIIEVDGSSHNQLDVRIKDLKRQMELEDVGFTVLRFTDEEVLENMDDVKRVISDTLVDLVTRESSLWNQTSLISVSPQGETVGGFEFMWG